MNTQFIQQTTVLPAVKTIKKKLLLSEKYTI